MKLIDEYAGLHWQMTTCEKFAMQDILRRLSPDVAIEIGTYQGGSLQVLSHFAQQVVSIDIEPSVPERLSAQFGNVEFHTGPSSILLPDIWRSYIAQNRRIEFLLIDGDHSAQGVRRDIAALLSVRPNTRCIVLMHDSFNPDCREGIRSAAWADCEYVHSLELDFIPGIFHEHAYDTAAAGSMWGGFACAVIEHRARQHTLTVQASQQALFEAVLRASCYASSPSWRSKIKTLASRIGVWR